MARSSAYATYHKCASAGRVTAAVLLSFLAFAPSIANASGGRHEHLSEDVFLPPGPLMPSNPEPLQPAEHTFTLRHIYHHGTYLHPQLHRKRDIVQDGSKVLLAAEDGYGIDEIPRLSAKSRGAAIERLKDRRPSVVDPIVAQARQQGFAAVLDASAWTVDEVPTPDVTDKITVLSMAYMAADAYVENDELPDWEEVGGSYNRTADFGWESDGLRGHIWSDEGNNTVVIGMKGTSPAVFDGDGTTTNDKVNDNLFFSCCCAQQGPWTWHQVCDCATGTYQCNNTCVTSALREENRYYTAARELYSNVTALYPGSTIWIAGHSLGGAVASMLGLTYGVPVVTFEAVPEALPAARLGIPVPPGSNPKFPQSWASTSIYHFGHTADPVYIGTCNGATASCSLGGYAMESTCHAGKECVYDVVADKGWRVGIGTHKIRAVIKDVILQYDTVPKCEANPECRDCAMWKMYESNGTETTTTSTQSTSSRIRTRTSTCETPGWWGCLDETTKTATTLSTSTTSSSTSTCKTPGWFGCKDKTTTTKVTTTTITTTEPTATSTTTTCKTPGRFWGCYDDDEATATSPSPVVTTAPRITSAPTATSTSTTTDDENNTHQTRKCLGRNWLGFCTSWEHVEEELYPDEI
ncbi:putative lipase ATG15 [Paramyrothecium foliicola]|nr:putative lipase ATG15 [Paramyrothecium foliicola]